MVLDVPVAGLYIEEKYESGSEPLGISDTLYIAFNYCYCLEVIMEGVLEYQSLIDSRIRYLVTAHL